MSLTSPQLILFLLSGTLGVVGNMLLKAGMNAIKDVDFSLSALVPSMLKMFTNPAVFIGFVLYGVSSILYLKLIAQLEITKIYPLVVAYMFLLLMPLGAIFLKEQLTLTKVAGATVIITGIFIASR